ncbi:CPCC family cysteine-rich protein [Brevibacillus formosus]|uniref:CPCC family cysteine-rich protein n=1 Tax=Brevibacillus formosus TaxID=54913 RepID=UPI001CA48BF2|nr:CPCC family cysteine-rich protein [Brevibacillus formosus]
MTVNKYTCPCCGYKTLDFEGEFDICPICFWEDDYYQFMNPASDRGANRMSLREAQKNFILLGACDDDGRQYVRTPTSADEKTFGLSNFIY